MENIFSKIDKIFEQTSDDVPKWAEEILCEIKEIKRLLLIDKKIPQIKISDNSDDIKSFIRGFRKMLRKDDMFVFQGQELSINDKGLLYDINSNSILTSHDAYDVYGHIFKNNLEIKPIDSSRKIA